MCKKHRNVPVGCVCAAARGVFEFRFSRVPKYFSARLRVRAEQRDRGVLRKQLGNDVWEGKQFFSQLAIHKVYCDFTFGQTILLLVSKSNLAVEANEAVSGKMTKNSHRQGGAGGEDVSASAAGSTAQPASNNMMNVNLNLNLNLNLSFGGGGTHANANANTTESRSHTHTRGLSGGNSAATTSAALSSSTAVATVSSNSNDGVLPALMGQPALAPYGTK